MAVRNTYREASSMLVRPDHIVRCNILSRVSVDGYMLPCQGRVRGSLPLRGAKHIAVETDWVGDSLSARIRRVRFPLAAPNLQCGFALVSRGGDSCLLRFDSEDLCDICVEARL